MVLFYLYFMSTFLGFLIGSFLNVVIYRGERGINFIKGRSFCPKCRSQIRWYDNIPLLSFLFLRGKCRNCKGKISLRYPLVEFLTGIVTLLVANRVLSFDSLDWRNFSFWKIFDLFCFLCLAWGAIVIFFIDLDSKVIPDFVTGPLILIFLIRVLIIRNWWLLAAGAGAFLFLFLVFLVTKGRGMGFGDVKMAFLMGIALGWPKIVLAFYIAFLTGALIGIILIMTRKAKIGQQIAFGPFLSVATFVSIIWGEEILQLILPRFF